MFNKRLIPGIVMESMDDDGAGERDKLVSVGGGGNGSSGDDGAGGANGESAATDVELSTLDAEVFDTIDSPLQSSPK